MVRGNDHDLRRLLEQTSIGMFRCNEAGTLHFVNEGLVRMLGYDTTEQVLGLNLDEIYVDADDRPKMIASYRARTVVEGVLARWRARDGRILQVRLFGHSSEGPDGLSIDATALDVTGFEEATHELRRQRNELDRTASTLDQVLRQIPAIYWLVDHDLALLQVEGAVEETLGYEKDRYIGRTIHDALHDNPATTDVIAMHRRALGGETVSYESEYMGRNLTNRIAPYRMDDKIVGAVGTSIDVTASRALERRLVDAQRAESLGVLAGGLAHDFNNLLVAILGNADLALREVPLGTPGRGALEAIRNAGLRAAELTDQLLSYAGRGEVAVSQVAVGPLVDELLQLCSPVFPDGMKIHLDIERGLTLHGDAPQVRQVILNLILNARDAVRDHGSAIAIAAQAIDHDGKPDPDDVLTTPPGNYVVIDVADDGLGIDRDLRRRIFDPFFTTKPTGHGLGLAAVLGIVRAHHGGLRLVSAPSRGAWFRVLWPSFAPTTEQTAAASAAERVVLVIDDEALVRDVLARMIEDLGYRALTAADGHTGLDIAANSPVHAVIVDLTMPGMNGADVIATLRETHPGLPIVLCTGYDRDRKRPVTADAYLRKPFRLDALQQTLTKLLG
ncbi:MAG: response regulator [Kofleriaceae bacterium]